MVTKHKGISSYELQEKSDTFFFIGEEKIFRWAILGDELIELDESMFTNGFCSKCKVVGVCKKLNQVCSNTIE